MGSFSVWHWLVVLLVLAVPIGAVWLVIHRARRRSTKGEPLGPFRDPTALGKWTRWLVYAFLAMSILGFVSDIFVLSLLNDFKRGVYTSQAEAIAAGEASDQRQSAIAAIQIIVFVTSGVLILMWIYRANFNARRLGTLGMQFTPGWSVGWYFVPFANLVKPYRVMKELWQTSGSPSGWKDQYVSSLIGWWWLLWLTWNVVGNISLRLSLGTVDLDKALLSSTFDTLHAALGIPLCLLLLNMMKHIQLRQMSLHAHQLDPAA